jgi:hypothetical protein
MDTLVIIVKLLGLLPPRIPYRNQTPGNVVKKDASRRPRHPSARDDARVDLIAKKARALYHEEIGRTMP